MKFNVACIQLTCTNKVEENLQSITDYANEAIKAGADFILTPENSSLFSLDGKELLATCEGYEKNLFIQSIQKLSKSAKKWFKEIFTKEKKIDILICLADLQKVAI